MTASTDATHVTITPRGTTPAANGAPAFAAGIAQTVALDRGDTLEIMSSDPDDERGGAPMKRLDLVRVFCATARRSLS